MITDEEIIKELVDEFKRKAALRGRPNAEPIIFIDTRETLDEAEQVPPSKAPGQEMR